MDDPGSGGGKLLMATLEVDLDRLRESVTAELGGVQR
jgi:hypothetical protein